MSEHHEGPCGVQGSSRVLEIPGKGTLQVEEEAEDRNAMSL